MSDTEPDGALAKLNFATFHRDEVRHETYRAGVTAPYYDTYSRTWMVLDPWQYVELLEAPGLRAVSVSFDGLSKRFDLDLSGLRQIDAHVPLYKEGEEHTQARRRFTERLVERRAALRAWIENEVEAFLAPMGRPGEVDVTDDVLRPMIRSFLSVLTGVDLENGPPIDLTSLVFDGSVSLKRRLSVFDQLLTLRKYVEGEVGGSLKSEDIDLMVVFTMFGKDPLQYTFGESLKWMLDQHPTMAWRDMTFPDSPPQTGVPFLERIATEPVSFRGITIAAGDRIRFFTQGFGYFDELTDIHRYFGGRAHVCIGRPISVELWRRIVSVLSRFEVVPRIVEYQLDTDNFIFTGPKRLRLSLSAGDKSQ